MNRYIARQKIIELNSITKAAEALGYSYQPNGYVFRRRIVD